VVPPFCPEHVQYQEPLLVTELGVPAKHRLVEGAVVNDPPLAEPH